MNKTQLENLIVKPMLRDIPSGLSEPSLLATMMVIAHESKRGEYIHQMNNGPALGLIQMEPRTHDSVWRYGESCWRNAVLCGITTKDRMRLTLPPAPERLLYDIKYNVFMLRQRLFMKSESLPNLEGLDQLYAMNDYLKKHWNTVIGAAERHSYVNDYVKWES